VFEPEVVVQMACEVLLYAEEPLLAACRFFGACLGKRQVARWFWRATEIALLAILFKGHIVLCSRGATRHPKSAIRNLQSAIS
jgi:hypothetical protein